MFRKISERITESDTGFILDTTEWKIMKYIESTHILKLSYVMDQDERGIFLEYDPMEIKKWLPPHDEETISDIKKKEIIKNIKEELEFRGIRNIQTTP